MGVWSYDFVELQTHDGPQAPAHDVDRRVYSLSSVGKSHDPMPHRPRSTDRTQSPVAVSQKREYFKHPPETIGIFRLRVARFWSLETGSHHSGGRFGSVRNAQHIELGEWRA
jgi:hypothetical protein